MQRERILSWYVDTLTIARRRFPGSPASLDALCRRFAIDLRASSSMEHRSIAVCWQLSISSCSEVVSPDLILSLQRRLRLSRSGR